MSDVNAAAIEAAEHEWILHVHVDGDDREYAESLMDAVAKLVYEKFPDGNPIVSGHIDDCPDSDHCCGPGSNYLRDHDTLLRTEWETELRALVEARSHMSQDDGKFIFLRDLWPILTATTEPTT